MATIRIEDAKEYGFLDGFVIEQFRQWNGDEHESWAIPAWEEMGFADLDGVFPTQAAAKAAMASCGMSTKEQAHTAGGILLLIHPQTDDVVACKKGEGALARSLILDGYEPVGPRGKAAAAKIRATGEAR